MRLVVPLDTPGALLEGLRCLTASRPFPTRNEFLGKNHVEIPAHIKANGMIANALLFAVVILLGYGFWCSTS
jgi:hypothetical protein